MVLDISTLTAVTAFVAIIAGAFLMVVGRHYRQGPVAMLWGISSLFGAIAIGLLAERAPPALIFYFGALAAATAWIAMRHFHGRSFPTPWLLAGGAVWLAAEILLPDRWSPVVFQLVPATFMGAAAFELWRGRQEKLGARIPMMVLLGTLATMVGSGAAITIFMPVESTLAMPAFAWFGGLQTLANVVLNTMLLMLMIKERGVLQVRAAAETDQLTGLLNRGAFVERARLALKSALARDVPFAAVIFDLDYFKRINDSFGHRTGDSVLRRFGDLVLRGLRRDDIAGRIGGEEFAMVMPGAGPEAAVALADRIRAAFAEEAKWVDGQGVKATLSAGVAMAEPGSTLDDILDAADQALYAAKARGRNKVQLQTGVEPADAVVVRIA
jgi:diguanylate cyclase (GGDEF)-like protein